VDGTQVGILEKTNKVSLGGLLKGKNGRSLESKIGLEILGDLTHQTLEWQLADQQVGGLLVTTDLTKSDGTWAVTVGLLDSSGGGGRLTSSLGGKLLTGSLSSSGFTSGLLSSGHFVSFKTCFCELIFLRRQILSSQKLLSSDCVENVPSLRQSKHTINSQMYQCLRVLLTSFKLGAISPRRDFRRTILQHLVVSHTNGVRHRQSTRVSKIITSISQSCNFAFYSQTKNTYPNMSGRGKGGKGLGKGGAKRHRKVLRDNIQGITKPAIRRLARRGGVKRISGLIYEETRKY
jgi:hypothetical protein